MHNISSEELETIRGQMLKFATLQLKDPILAEDVVQEAFVSALKNIESFKRQSALKTWIFAILKNKIIDYLRVNHRFVVESELITDEDENSFFDGGRWRKEYAPSRLQENENTVYSEQFWGLFEVCLTRLPALQAKVFMMREYLELTSEDICSTEQITTSNLHVLLYRARLQLQHCLTTKMGER
ncbi:sigma-70 family RNA polymerase sigma factor [Pasteurella multocida]|uniref:sigma-70 family RNA polymerase sigma factor n=1 Tax=Pasteurella multocida TaxID=747 RepID=UPI0007E51C78|nr:sigma-70 family RNA polymerase sigma factor [Pasteurella multocida]APW58480.1 RNA polymerase subunit sigma [Pasteurella multocida]AXQ71844.1 RNA polymerase subunit sigma [Pasteurella multocida subsp. multocida]MCH4804358.1 sigma-70 family RNA polymerase sigma factor [Pasteurella multocida]MCL7851145.1 sigma-70 family RNA polymerase sigma factor [Pasteurella multocida]MCZ0722998.1 sigma-70 family RNA polymerase sigma factor [Pasteurella multocida]